MDKLIKSTRKKYDKSEYRIEIRNHQSGEHYLKLEHTINATGSKNEVFISSQNLIELMEILNEYSMIMGAIKSAEWSKLRDVEDERLIVSLFLKGVTIKDLSLSYRYTEEIIINILTKNEIEIIDGIELPKPKWSSYKRKKK